MEVKIKLKEINQILHQSGIGLNYEEIDTTPHFAVCHIHKWDHGYYEWWGTKVYEGGIYETGDWFWGTRRAFYVDFQEMVGFFKQYCYHADIQYCIVAPCWKYNQFEFGKFVPENDICEETYQLLREHGIRKGERSGIALSIEKDWGNIELILEGGFRGYTTLSLLCPEQGLLLTPNHHFGVTFYTQSKDREKELVSTLLPEHPTLQIWDGEGTGTVPTSSWI